MLTATEEKWTRARLLDELVIWSRSVDVQIDENTGHRRSKYERLAEFIIHRINTWKPKPIFKISLSDFKKYNEKLGIELTKLDKQTRDEVITEAIVLLLDSIAPRYFRLNIKRRDICWEITP